MKMIPNFSHMMLKREQRWYYPLDVHLKLRRRKVKALDDLRSDVSRLQSMRRIDIVPECLIFQVLALSHIPQFFFHTFKQPSCSWWVGKQESPIRDVVLRADAVQVDWRKCQHIVEYHDVDGVLTQGNSVWETFAGSLDPKQEGTKNIVRFADHHILDICATTVALHQGEGAWFGAFRAHLHIIVESPPQLGVGILCVQIIDGSFEGWLKQLALTWNGRIQCATAKSRQIL
mmetsp:Transcript_25786/g.56078  ORF Transcript_25786/g.56078 Transcript_25786/m.56078 type:complete len:231 (-) Transcript_25786:137-829(-)